MEITIRASMLPGYADCPRRASIPIIRDAAAEAGYTFRHTPTSIGAAVGTGVHAGARYALESKMVGESVKLADVEGRALARLKEGVAEGVVWDTTTGNGNDAERQVRTLSKSFVTEVAPNIAPQAIERRRRAQFLENVIISGQSDAEETDAINDWKCGKMLGNYHGQLGAYSLLRRGEGAGVTRLSLWHLPRVPVKKPYPGAYRHNVDVDIAERAAWATIQHIIRDVRQFLATRDPWSFAANPSSVICGDKYCRAYGTPWCELTMPRATVIIGTLTQTVGIK